MGNAAKQIIEMNIKELIELLNKALADEWLAYYQYWIGARVVTGSHRKVVAAELSEHANEELKHAEMLVTRIMQLQEKPLLKPDDWMKMSTCGYAAPKNFAEKSIVEQNLKGERCAIHVYKKILDLCEGKDAITYDMILSILKDEIEHEDDLQNLLEDIKS